MRAIDIVVNGQLKWRAGIANASILAPYLHAWVGDESPASIGVSGMCDLEQGRIAHVRWCEGFPVAEGDTVVFRFVDSDEPTPPAEIIPTDSPAYLEEQRAFTESVRNLVPDTAPAARLNPALSFDYRLNGQPPARVSLVGGEEHILCSLLWMKQHPDQCRIFIRSFGDKAKPEHSPATEWCEAILAVNEAISVRIAA